MDNNTSSEEPSISNLGASSSSESPIISSGSARPSKPSRKSSSEPSSPFSTTAEPKKKPSPALIILPIVLVVGTLGVLAFIFRDNLFKKKDANVVEIAEGITSSTVYAPSEDSTDPSADYIAQLKTRIDSAKDNNARFVATLNMVDYLLMINDGAQALTYIDAIDSSTLTTDAQLTSYYDAYRRIYASDQLNDEEKYNHYAELLAPYIAE